MENIGPEPATVHARCTAPATRAGTASAVPTRWPPHRSRTTTTSSRWSGCRVTIRWLVDQREYRRTTPADLPAGTTWVFDHPFFLLLNLAVGGVWPGDPDASTVLPQQMLVDYVRVYRR